MCASIKARDVKSVSNPRGGLRDAEQLIERKPSGEQRPLEDEAGARNSRVRPLVGSSAAEALASADLPLWQQRARSQHCEASE